MPTALVGFAVVFGPKNVFKKIRALPMNQIHIVINMGVEINSPGVEVIYCSFFIFHISFFFLFFVFSFVTSLLTLNLPTFLQTKKKVTLKIYKKRV